VEDRPDRACNDVPHGEQHTKATWQPHHPSGDQHEHQLTSVHVAEQSHAVRNRLGNVLICMARFTTPRIRANTGFLKPNGAVTSS
jgi:hypothetical protein